MRIDRREFLKKAGVAGIVLAGTACAPAVAPTPTAVPAPTKPASVVAGSPTAVPAVATPTAKPATVHFGSVKAASDAGVYIAIDRGYFAEQGITLDLQAFASGAAMLAPLSSGDLDIYGSSLATGILAAIDRGIGIKVLADKGTSGPGFEFAQIVIRKDLWDSGQVRGAKDLKGKKVGVTSLAGGSEAAFAYLLKPVGLSVKDLDLVSLSYPDMLVAFGNKGLDAADMTEPTLSSVVSNGLAVTWPGGTRSATYGGVYQAGDIIASAQFDKNIDVARRFMVAYLKGVRDYNDAFVKGKGKSDIVNILIKYTALKDPAQYDRMQMAGLNPDGKLATNTMTMDLDYFKQAGHYTGKLTINDIVDSQFADYAAQQLGPYK
ncbi:MAG: ABC transporter substrate-binding protein [Dehalococcoidia bacterium]|nr:ABC transporter substrate-binding protein [Dehalococcoidia bacterium]